MWTRPESASGAGVTAAFISLNAIFRFPDVYRAAVAVSPVTHWAFYDNIYTERYNGLPAENREGYDEGSPLTHVSGLRG